MRLIRTYKFAGKDAFSIIYSCRKRHGVYEHNLITTLPQECLNFVHYNFFFRMTEDYAPRMLEAYKMMEKLADEIRKVEQFKVFFFSDYLLFGGKIEDDNLKELFDVHKEFKLKSGEHFCANTRSLEFSVLVKELNCFRIFQKRKFEKRYKKSTRKDYELALIPGRMGSDYIELYKPNNSFFTLQQDQIKFFFLCEEEINIQMIIAHNVRVNGENA